MRRQEHYEAMALNAERQVERALTAGMADCWREIANGYRDLATAWAEFSLKAGELPAASLSA